MNVFGALFRMIFADNNTTIWNISTFCLIRIKDPSTDFLDIK